MEFLNRLGKKGTSDRWLNLVLFSLIFFGIFTVLLVFFNNRSLWLDEAKLANNIVRRGFVDLLTPLDRSQVAPIGFLYVEKFFVLLFGNRDWALRVFPMLSFFASIPLFFSLNYRLFQSKNFALFACAIFSLTVSLLNYSSEVKQYASDALIALLVTWLALNFHESKHRNSLILYTIGGVLAIWFSNIAVIMLFVAGTYSLYTNYRSVDRKITSAMIPIVFWLVSFCTYYALFIHNHPTQEMMVNHWDDSFMPLNIFERGFYVFLLERVEIMFGSLLGFSKLWIVPFVFGLVGIVSNKKSKRILFLVLFPVIVHLGLSGFRLYPFDGRLILYLVPFLVILYAQGLWSLFGYVNNKNPKLSMYLLIIPLVINGIIVGRKLPFEHEEIKKSMTFIGQNMEPNSVLYVNRRAIPAFEFYKKDYPQIEAMDSIIYSVANRSDWSKIDGQILKLSGNFWMLFSHMYIDKKIKLTEEKYIIETLEANGYKLVKKKKYYRSSAYEMKK